MNTAFKRACALALGLGLSACAAKQTIVLMDNDANWKRSVEGSFVVYRIAMSGMPPYTEIVVPDDAAAAAFRSLVPERIVAPKLGAPAVTIRSLGEYVRYRDGAIANLKAKDMPFALADRNADVARVQSDLKDHSAVVFNYVAAPER